MAATTSAPVASEIPVEAIVAGDNDRTHFDPDALQALADSIARDGLLSPITVRPMGDGFEIIAGERRFRATKLAGLPTIPAMVRDVDDATAARLMGVENVNRADLDPIDEAGVYRKAIDRFGRTVDDCAADYGVDRVQVIFRLALLDLIPELQQAVRVGTMTVGVARDVAQLNEHYQREWVRATGSRDMTAAAEREVARKLQMIQGQNDLFDAEAFEMEVEVFVAEQATAKRYGKKALADLLAEALPAAWASDRDLGNRIAEALEALGVEAK